MHVHLRTDSHAYTHTYTHTHKHTIGVKEQMRERKQNAMVDYWTAETKVRATRAWNETADANLTCVCPAISVCLIKKCV